MEPQLGILITLLTSSPLKKLQVGSKHLNPKRIPLRNPIAPFKEPFENPYEVP